MNIDAKLKIKMGIAAPKKIKSHYSRPCLNDYATSSTVPQRQDIPNGNAGAFPKVSIVTSTFNSSKTLSETIKSVREQDYPNLEYVIVDANSSDATEELIEKNRDIITIYCREADDGIYDGINKGIGLTTGDIIKITNADDLLEPDSVQRAVDCIKASENPSRTIVNSYLNIINQDSEVIDLFTDRWIVDSVPAFLHPSWYVPAEIYREFGLYSLELNVASDYEYYLYIRQACKFITLEKPLAAYRTDGRSSGFEGMHEAIEISKRYLSASDAKRITRKYWIQKIRKLALTRLFGQRGFYRIKYCCKKLFRPKNR